MFLDQDRKWFSGQGSYIEMGEKFPKCIAETFY